MFGTRQDPALFRGRAIFALSVLALLALGCLPVLAQAESSAGLQYQDAPPTVPGHTATNDKESTAHKANTGGGGGSGEDSGSPGGGSAKDGSSDKTGNGAGAGGGDQQGSQGDRADKGSAPNPKQATHIGAKTPTSEDDGGSSPLVPILIAIAVLAAISIGVVVVRQRRRGDPSSGSPVSSEVG